VLIEKVNPEMLATVSDGFSERAYHDRLQQGSALIKAAPEDFIVEELPLYECSGAGEHAYLLIEKRQLSTGGLIERLVHSLGIHRRDIGYAGRKDTEGITRQWVSVPARSLSDKELGDDRYRIVRRALHGNKLRLGHLRGNRFCLRLCRVAGIDAGDLASRLSRRAEEGFWNIFGVQRFGARGRSLNLALKWLDVPNQHRHGHRASPDLLASVFQAAVFNWSTLLRLQSSMGMDLTEADIPAFAMRRSRLGAQNVEQKVPSGPLWGVRMRRASGAVGEYEHRALDEWTDGNAQVLERIERWAPGDRRALIAFPDEFSAEVIAADELRLNFVLPPGSYATVFLDSVIPIGSDEE
jgi:tRNA pseudouridine13 synthase